MIGDPTERSETRPRLTHEQVLANAESYKQQVFKIVDPDPSRLEISMNGSWFSKMSFADVMELAGKYTVARILERDDFSQRFKSEQPISIHELFYPLMQGYDSVAIKSDVELGATEQKFNCLVGRELMQRVRSRAAGRDAAAGSRGDRRRPAHEQEHRELHRHQRAVEGDLREDDVDPGHDDHEVLRTRDDAAAGGARADPRSGSPTRARTRGT